MNKILVGLLGDRQQGYLPHESAEKALVDAGLEIAEVAIDFQWLPTETSITEGLGGYDCIWAGPGPYLDEENALRIIQFAREHEIPTIGTCSGFKYMVIEHAKHVFRAMKPFNYISRNEFCTTDYEDLAIDLNAGCHLINVYGNRHISEISHCTFEIADGYVDKVASAFEFCGVSEDGRTVLIRLNNHPFFVASLFLPQLKEDSKLLHTWLQTTIALKQNKALIG